MSIPLDAPEVLNREFLEVRARLLQVAAALDRLDRADRAEGAEGAVADDARVLKIRQALEILAGDEADRAERIQLVFSRPYESGWKAAFGHRPNRS